MWLICRSLVFFSLFSEHRMLLPFLHFIVVLFVECERLFFVLALGDAFISTLWWFWNLVTHALCWTCTNALLFLNCSSEISSIFCLHSSSIKNVFNSRSLLTPKKTASRKCGSAGAVVGGFFHTWGSTQLEIQIYFVTTDHISTIIVTFA